MISSFSLRSETSEKTAFFRFEAKSFSLHFRFVSLRTENDGAPYSRITIFAQICNKRVLQSRSCGLSRKIMFCLLNFALWGLGIKAGAAKFFLT
jgi:hypothetical protein